VVLVVKPVWSAMTGGPVRFLRSGWPWRCLAYLCGTVVVAGVLVPALVFPPVLVLVGLPVGALERWRLRLVDPMPAASPHAGTGPGAGAWLRRRLSERATWREFGYVLCLLTVLVVVDLVGLLILFLTVLLLALPLFFLAGGTALVDVRVGPLAVDSIGDACAVGVLVGAPTTVVVLYALSVLAVGQAAFARWLVAPADTALIQRVDELTASRIRLVTAFEAERRRIERDLHDGAQQHLVLLNMNLGLIEVELGEANPRAGALLAEARRQARQALVAIREQIRGIHPQVLTDLGLRAAVVELAERCPVPVEIDLVLLDRSPVAVESTAYFVVSEALTNAVRHAAASRIEVSGGIVDGRLVVTITDDGHGGADPAAGTGLRGLADRAAVMDGTLTVTSPAGGPTTLQVELPCHCE
jgi:signal transduction histidine kinase